MTTQTENSTSRYEQIDKELRSAYHSSLQAYLEFQEGTTPSRVQAAQNVLTQVTGILYLTGIDLAFRLQMIDSLADHSIRKINTINTPTELHVEEHQTWLAIKEIIES